MIDPDRCRTCNRLLPVPRPVPEGARQPKRRRYCSAECARRAATERRAKLPRASDVLLAIAKAGIELRPDGTGNLLAYGPRRRRPGHGVEVANGRLAFTDDPLARVYRRHHDAIMATIVTTQVAAMFTLPAELDGHPCIGCDQCCSVMVGRGRLGSPCHLTYGCAGRFAILVTAAHGMARSSGRQSVAPAPPLIPSATLLAARGADHYGHVGPVAHGGPRRVCGRGGCATGDGLGLVHAGRCMAMAKHPPPFWGWRHERPCNRRRPARPVAGPAAHA